MQGPGTDAYARPARWLSATRSVTATDGAQRICSNDLGEVKRRTKVIGRFSCETSCLTLVWAVPDLLFSHASNGATFTDLDRKRLHRIKYPPPEASAPDEEVTAA